jgi:glycosyltransferase involved in cell wall biosynthesis
VYHTDFAEQVLKMTEDNLLADSVDTVTNLFFKQFDHTYVPSDSYIELLAKRGLKRESMSIFPRGIDATTYRPMELPRSEKQSSQPFTLLFAGRISHDKNLNLLLDLAQLLQREDPDRYRLVIAGDGPALSSLKQEAGDNIHFTGRVSSDELVVWYNKADLFVFPSHTDTFGMVVLEAQACGLPCLVTNTGGPKEIIVAGETGRVMLNDDPQAWREAVEYYAQLKDHDLPKLQSIKEQCVWAVQRNNSWEAIFSYLFGADFVSHKPDSNVQKTVQSYPLDKIA